MKALNVFLNEQKIGLVDIGASGGVEDRWLEVEENLKTFLFEPDKRSYEALKSHKYVEEIFPVGLGEKETKKTLYLCRKPQASSLLSPEYGFLSNFPGFQRFDLISKELITLSTLDVCLKDKEEDCDFIKIDTQGTELDILKGGEHLLNSPIIGLEIEVEFVRLYENQPLFGDVCSYLDSKGYQFFDFVNICRWERSQFTLFGQAVFGDAFFLRSPESFAEILHDISPELAQNKAKKYIAVAALYDHIDLLPVCIECFKSFLNDDDVLSLSKLYKSLLKRRKKSSFILQIMNRLLRPLGIAVTGFQKS